MISLPAGAALAAITGAISGGFFAGGLHAIAGKLLLLLFAKQYKSTCDRGTAAGRRP
jgi:hypothetical protein